MISGSTSVNFGQTEIIFRKIYFPQLPNTWVLWKMIFGNDFQPIQTQPYSHEFRVPKDKSLWREVAGPKLYPNPEMLRDKGRLMSTRIRNEMDWRESQPKPKCGVCHEEGHNRRRCPNVTHASTSSNVPNQVSNACNFVILQPSSIVYGKFNSII